MEIKEVCGFQDSRGRFFPTKEEAHLSNETERKASEMHKFLKNFSTNRWSSYGTISDVVELFLKDPQLFYQFYSDYHNEWLTVTLNKKGVVAVSMVSPNSPPLSLNKKVSVNIFKRIKDEIVNRWF